MNVYFLFAIIFDQFQIIHNNAFYSSSLTEIKIPKYVKKIEYGAFHYCNFLNKVVFDDDSELVEIQYNAFSSTAIEKIKIPRSVQKIGNQLLLNLAINLLLLHLMTIQN